MRVALVGGAIERRQPKDIFEDAPVLNDADKLPCPSKQRQRS